MTARSTSRLPFAWTDKAFHEDVLPDKRRLATALQRICRRLTIRTPDGVTPTHPTQAQAATYLRISETALTRYLRAQHVPAYEVTAFIFDTACRDAGGEQNLGITREDLLELRAHAEQERCGNCSRHRQAVRTAEQELKAIRKKLQRSEEEKATELREARQHASALKREAQRARTEYPVAQPVLEAGPQRDQRAAQAATQLPVPRRQGDRQQGIKEAAAASVIARRAEELLQDGRPDSTLALLRHTAEAYTSAEMAALVPLLRTRGQHELVANLVHIYGRDRTDRDVVQAALLLHQHNAVKDAEALLRAAAARLGPATP
ncbi:hypothetical protein [Streptomyces sp. CA-251251]|uniref:hypothetical protein n=1 Tax=Streptomyces sp. CA-251251 TaxID=3240063 RepID=UPI003D8B5FC2